MCAGLVGAPPRAVAHWADRGRHRSGGGHGEGIHGGRAAYLDRQRQGRRRRRKIEIITLDDAFDVKKAEANARTLIEERGVLAFS